MPSNSSTKIPTTTQTTTIGELSQEGGWTLPSGTDANMSVPAYWRKQKMPGFAALWETLLKPPLPK